MLRVLYAYGSHVKKERADKGELRRGLRRKRFGA